MPANHTKALVGLLIILVAAASPMAMAKKSDRQQAMDISAGKQEGSLDDSTPTVLSGGVVIDQGTLHAEASRADIRSRGGDISQVVLTGSPAKMSQQMDDGSRMNAVANKIDYNVTTDTVVFTGKVNIQQPRGTLSGERVVYNMTTGQVTSGGEGNGRVNMRIMPRNAAPAEKKKAAGEAETE
ncbi:lipopolysaccharide transport periplasmic protein LptA [Lysobacter ciconiae]|uniref:Lipopolysaccharide export system protein LptA n=1 Tax=Novilysobacter ciconiae TaxID=2781022 RepID=A0A7S6UHD6_9GAMM|nr:MULTISPECIES: lipopolysaccharide transport periplasmic protein LptA [Lysobacter]QOW20244.1 lipopolysaccharide transport periplasmic protein LptA [Lysobacter ciconiae]QOY63451.1 lipopolysaccharide transport periplasmic protein LptA [Lysobacter sp. H21R4]